MLPPITSSFSILERSFLYFEAIFDLSDSTFVFWFSRRCFCLSKALTEDSSCWTYAFKRFNSVVVALVVVSFSNMLASSFSLFDRRSLTSSFSSRNSFSAI